MSMEFVHNDGIDFGDVKLYALSTCGWCNKTKNLLKDLGVGFSYLYVDLLTNEEMEKIVLEIEKYNPNCSFPTLVINNSKTIVGFKENEIREAFRK